ncbi:hypothetical protein LTR37_008962, partial [Vermiconidia calcicola]
LTVAGPEETIELLAEEAKDEEEDEDNQLDLSARMTLYKFSLEEHDKSREREQMATILLVNRVAGFIKTRLPSFDDLLAAWIVLDTQYGLFDVRTTTIAFKGAEGCMCRYLRRTRAATMPAKPINGSHSWLERKGPFHEHHRVGKHPWTLC